MGSHIAVDESQEVPEKDNNPVESLWLAKAAVQGRLTGVRPTELVRLDDQYAYVLSVVQIF